MAPRASTRRRVLARDSAASRLDRHASVRGLHRPRCVKIVRTWRLRGGHHASIHRARFRPRFRCGGLGLHWPLAQATTEAPAMQSAPAAAGGVTAFVGARVIVGDGTVIENATFTLGPDKHFGLVGSTAAVTLPAGVRKVDLAGLTVMPAIVDAHTHLSRERDALIADLKHRAYFGVSAALSLGQDNGTRRVRRAQGSDPGRRALPARRPRYHGAGARPQRHSVLGHLRGRGARGRPGAGRARRRHHQDLGGRPSR